MTYTPLKKNAPLFVVYISLTDGFPTSRPVLSTRRYVVPFLTIAYFPTKARRSLL